MEVSLRFIIILYHLLIENGRKKVIDISTPSESKEVCDITEGIIWKETNLSYTQLQTIKEWWKNIKQGVLV